MKDLTTVLAELPNLPMDRLVVLTVLGALGVVAFALYVVLTVVKQRGEK